MSVIGAPLHLKLKECGGFDPVENIDEFVEFFSKLRLGPDMLTSEFDAEKVDYPAFIEHVNGSMYRLGTPNSLGTGAYGCVLKYSLQSPAEGVPSDIAVKIAIKGDDVDLKASRKLEENHVKYPWCVLAKNIVVMPCFDGDLLKFRRDLTHSNVINIARQVLTQVMFLSSNGIGYLDIKPGNTLVSTCGGPPNTEGPVTIFLGDMGSADDVDKPLTTTYARLLDSGRKDCIFSKESVAWALCGFIFKTMGIELSDCFRPDPLYTRDSLPSILKNSIHYPVFKIIIDSTILPFVRGTLSFESMRITLLETERRLDSSNKRRR